MSRGKFITIDGLEGAGKSTQIDFIKKFTKSFQILNDFN